MPETMAPGEWLNTDELLEAFRRRGLPCSRRTLHRWIDDGLPSHQPGGERGRRVYVWVEVERWLRSRCIANTPGRGTRRHTTAHAETTVVIPCSGAKLDVPAPAGIMYTGQLHQLARRAAQALAPDRVLILSGLYGLVELHEIIDPYEQRIDRPGGVELDELARQIDQLKLYEHRTVALTPAAYTSRLTEAGLELVTPLAGCRGIGEMRARLSMICRLGRLELDERAA